MPKLVHCPNCDRSLRVPEELLGSSVQCPACNLVFTAGSGAAASASATSPLGTDGSPEAEEVPIPPIQGLPPPPKGFQPVLVSSSTDQGPATRPRRETRCFECGEPVMAGMIRCPSCGELVEEEDFRPWERPGAPLRRDVEEHRGSLILALGTTSLLFSLPSLCGFACPPFGIGGLISVATGLAAWLMGRADLKKMQDMVMDPAGQKNTETGRSCGMVGTLLSVLGLLLCGMLQLSHLIMETGP